VVAVLWQEKGPATIGRGRVKLCGCRQQIPNNPIGPTQPSVLLARYAFYVGCLLALALVPVSSIGGQNYVRVTATDESPIVFAGHWPHHARGRDPFGGAPITFTSNFDRVAELGVAIFAFTP